LRLAPASTVLEQRVTLYNRSDVRHRFYWWNNAGVRVWDDSKIWYPMRWTASHGFTEVDTWPVDSAGLDLSVIRNQTRGTVSRFVHGSREPFMGIYHPQTQTGVAHYAGYADLPAKKIWSWGVDADGLDWRRALSDDNSAYVEVQAGLMRNQETYAFLEPRQSIHLTEYWMPVRAIGGITRANLAGVLHLHREKGSLMAGFNTNRAVAGAKVRILEGRRLLREATVDLRPEVAWALEIADAPQSHLTFELWDATGHALMRQTEGEYDWTPEEEIRTGAQPRPPSGGPLDLGAGLELNGNLPGAYEVYDRALRQSPDDQALRVAAGRLAASLLRYEDAVHWLEPAQARATQDAEIAYYLGLAYQGLGRIRDARLQFETTRRMPRFRAAGNLKLAELLARQGDWAGASTYLEEALYTEPDDQRAREERIAVQRALGRTLDMARPPLSLFLSEETGSDAERVLAIAAQYMRLGLWREAWTVLARQYPQTPPEQSEPGVPLPQQHPLVAYYRAFCRQKLGEPAAADYDLAAKLPAAYVFPSGAQTLEAIETAVRERPRDATAHFLLGSLRIASGLIDAAIDEWRTARRSSTPPFRCCTPTSAAPCCASSTTFPLRRKRSAPAWLRTRPTPKSTPGSPPRWASWAGRRRKSSRRSSVIRIRHECPRRWFTIRHSATPRPGVSTKPRQCSKAASSRARRVAPTSGRCGSGCARSKPGSTQRLAAAAPHSRSWIISATQPSRSPSRAMGWIASSWPRPTRRLSEWRRRAAGGLTPRPAGCEA
jgi:tetratricopeptide (TPR) repeat protein